MSFVIIAIGAAHAIPPIIGGVMSKSKVGVLIGAAIGGIIAFASGNPVFVAFDLVGLALGTWLSLSFLGGKSTN